MVLMWFSKVCSRSNFCTLVTLVVVWLVVELLKNFDLAILDSCCVVVYMVSLLILAQIQ